MPAQRRTGWFKYTKICGITPVGAARAAAQCTIMPPGSIQDVVRFDNPQLRESVMVRSDARLALIVLIALVLYMRTSLTGISSCRAISAVAILL